MILNKNLLKLAAVVCFALSSLPSYGAVPYLDLIKDKEMTGTDRIAESQAYARTGSAVAKAADQDAKSEEQKKATEKIRSDLKTAAIKETKGFVKLINEKGTKSALDTISQYIQQKGFASQKGTVNGISYISYSFKPNKSPKAPDFVYQYSIDPGKNLCQVVTAIPALKIQEGAAAPYTEPPAAKLTVTERVGNYLGIALKDKQDKINGRKGFKILKADPKGLAGKAGVKQGDMLVKIDAFNIMNDHTVERISAYIDGRIQKKALLKVVIIRNGAKKNLEIQL